jgi:photosystem II stability/assembly factor-like uncharacterized protein
VYSRKFRLCYSEARKEISLRPWFFRMRIILAIETEEFSMTIALSHGGGGTVVSSDEPSTRVLVGTLDGVKIVERGEAGWVSTGHTLIGRHIHAIVLEPISGLWFAGVRKGGVFVSADDGLTWEKRSDGLSDSDIYSLSTVVVDGKAMLYAGTEPANLFASDDLGLSWTALPGVKDAPTSEAWFFPAEPHVAHVKHISFEPGDSKTIYASVEVGALLRSRDSGQSWEELNGGLYMDVHRCIITPAHPDRLYVTGGQGIWISNDAGVTWENPFARGSEEGGYPDQLVFKPSDPDQMIVSAGRQSPGSWVKETAQARISRTRDGGKSWEVLSHHGLQDRFPHSVEAMTLEEAGDSVQIFAGTTGGAILYSEDGGESWDTVLRGLSPISKGGHYVAVVGQPA